MDASFFLPTIIRSTLVRTMYGGRFRRSDGHVCICISNKQMSERTAHATLPRWNLMKLHNASSGFGSYDLWFSSRKLVYQVYLNSCRRRSD